MSTKTERSSAQKPYSGEEETGNNYGLRRSLRKRARCCDQEGGTEKVRKGGSEEIMSEPRPEG